MDLDLLKLLQASPPYVVNVVIVWLFLRFLHVIMRQIMQISTECHAVQREAMKVIDGHHTIIAELRESVHGLADVIKRCNIPGA